mmetsp:Transcript_16274/g.55407  ORF Transcript_16274/g.55407 Transcript_16274/m.55407 type:complete len:937 (-) Transcript_16274:8826-11636(-)
MSTYMMLQAAGANAGEGGAGGEGKRVGPSFSNPAGLEDDEGSPARVDPHEQLSSMSASPARHSTNEAGDGPGSPHLVKRRNSLRDIGEHLAALFKANGTVVPEPEQKHYDEVIAAAQIAQAEEEVEAESEEDEEERLSCSQRCCESVSSMLPPTDWYKHYIDPNGSFKRTWDWCVIILVVYIAVVIPYTAAFLFANEDWNDKDSLRAFEVIDRFMDVVFILDIVLNFRTAIVDTQAGGKLVEDQYKIASAYLRGWFALDLIASLPLDWWLGSSKGLGYLALIKCMRLLRLGRLMRKLDQLHSANAFRAVKMVLVFIMFAHWGACMWYLIGYVEFKRAQDNQDGGHVSWLLVAYEQDGLEPGRDTEALYKHAYFWAMSMMTPGYGGYPPEGEAEVIYATAMELLGAILSAVIFGNVAVLISSFDAAYARYRERMDTVNEFITANSIPEHLRKRMRSYIDYVFNVNKGLGVHNMSSILGELPEGIRTEIFMHLHEKLVVSVPMFSECDRALIKSLVMKLKQQVCFPDDSIVVEGEPGHEMFFLQHGKVEVCDAQCTKVYATLSDGAFFGEISLLTGGRRTATVRAVEMCEVYSLSQADFEEVLYDFPESKQKFRSIARKRLEDKKKQDSMLRNLSLKQAQRKRSNSQRRLSAAGRLEDSNFPLGNNSPPLTPLVASSGGTAEATPTTPGAVVSPPGASLSPSKPAAGSTGRMGAGFSRFRSASFDLGNAAFLPALEPPPDQEECGASVKQADTPKEGRRMSTHSVGALEAPGARRLSTHSIGGFEGSGGVRRMSTHSMGNLDPEPRTSSNGDEGSPRADGEARNPRHSSTFTEPDDPEDGEAAFDRLYPSGPSEGPALKRHDSQGSLSTMVAGRNRRGSGDAMALIEASLSARLQVVEAAMLRIEHDTLSSMSDRLDTVINLVGDLTQASGTDAGPTA